MRTFLFPLAAGTERHVAYGCGGCVSGCVNVLRPPSEPSITTHPASSSFHSALTYQTQPNRRVPLLLPPTYTAQHPFRHRCRHRLRDHDGSVYRHDALCHAREHVSGCRVSPLSFVDMGALLDDTHAVYLASAFSPCMHARVQQALTHTHDQLTTTLTSPENIQTTPTPWSPASF